MLKQYYPQEHFNDYYIKDINGKREYYEYCLNKVKKREELEFTLQILIKINEYFPDCGITLPNLNCDSIDKLEDKCEEYYEFISNILINPNHKDYLRFKMFVGVECLKILLFFSERFK